MEVRKEQIMKYVIYRFPDVIRFDRDDQYAEPYVVRKRGITKDALRGEIVAVEYGSDIEAVKDVLIKNIQEEMSHRTLKYGLTIFFGWSSFIQIGCVSSRKIRTPRK